MHDAPEYLDNARRVVNQWKQLHKEARAVDAREAAAVLRDAVAFGEDILSSYAPLADAYQRAYETAAAHGREVARAEAAAREGTFKRSALADVHQEHELLQREVHRTRSACQGHLANIAKRERELEPVAQAQVNIESIALCCSSGLGQQWHAANARLGGPSAAFEPIFSARVLREYEENDSRRAEPLTELRACLQHRAEQQKHARRRTARVEV